MPWRRKWQPTPVFLPGESHGQRSLEGCSPWGCLGSPRVLDVTERLTSLSHHHEACRLLVPSPGIEPGPSAVDEWSPNPGLAGRSAEASAQAVTEAEKPHGTLGSGECGVTGATSEGLRRWRRAAPEGGRRWASPLEQGARFLCPPQAFRGWMTPAVLGRASASRVHPVRGRPLPGRPQDIRTTCSQLSEPP